MYDLNITSEPRIKMGILESTSQWIAKVTQIHHKSFPDQQYRMYEVHDRSDSIDQLLNFDVHFALTNEKINHEDIASILYMKNHMFYSPLKMNFQIKRQLK